MPQSWDSYVREQEATDVDSYDVCPLRQPNGDLCGKPSHKSPKVKPFCHVAHRAENVRRENLLFEQKVVASCAEISQLVDNNGKVCVVQEVTTRELYDKNKKKGHRHKSGRYETKYVMRCGEEVSYPRAISAPAVTCIGCLAADSPNPPIHCPKCYVETGVAIPKHCPHH